MISSRSRELIEREPSGDRLTDDEVLNDGQHLVSALLPARRDATAQRIVVAQSVKVE